MGYKIFLPLFVLAVFLISCSENFDAVNREISFNNDWKFLRADVEDAEAPDFDDAGWRTLDLPHDYSIEDLPEREDIKQIGPFSEESAGGASTGHVVGGTAWYRKHFTLGKEDDNKIIQILFDGVYMNADFWLNGKHLGNHPYGYTAFAYDLTDYLNPAGEENVLAVQLKNEDKNSRWYSGSGIYRNVKLIKTRTVHVALWGNYITTPEASPEKATVKIESVIVNSAPENKNITVRATILNAGGENVATAEQTMDINSGTNEIADFRFIIDNPGLWSVDTPQLYTVQIQVEQGGALLDDVKEKFGIRSIDFSAEDGFLLNGKNVLLKGGCMHHDNGILGSAAFKTAEYRRVQKMKEYGFNAIRTSHNPPSKTFLDACDELGMLVMDESFDQWQKPKNPQDYNLYFDNWWEKDLESMILRDRNHPSIIIWSIGNEIKERADSSGLAIAKKLKTKIKSLDSQRPVTQAICSFWDNPGLTWEDTEPVFAVLDVGGYNYQWKQYEPDHEKFPERIMVGTESIAKEAFENWQMVKKHPYVIGDFVWTGMDYLGESGIGSTHFDNEKVSFLPPWPWFNAYCGDVGILGDKKPQLFYRQVVWGDSDLEMLVHVPVPNGQKEIVSFWGWPSEVKNWNWEGNEGKPLQVSVYSNYDQVRLELNGKPIETRNVSHETKLTATFVVPYQPGNLTAIGLKNGKEISRQTLKTAGKPAKLKITAERNTLSAGIDDLAYFNIEVIDESGNLVPNAELPVEFNIEGDGELQAVGNGNPTDMKSFQQRSVKTFRGKCQLIIRPFEEGGEIIISAKSEGLETGTRSIKMMKM